MPIKRILTPLHNSQHLLLLQSPANDLHADRQPRHLACVVVLVRALRDAVEVLGVEGCGQRVLDGVDVGYGEDAGGVVELQGLVVFFYFI